MHVLKAGVVKLIAAAEEDLHLNSEYPWQLGGFPHNIICFFSFFDCGCSWSLVNLSPVSNGSSALYIKRGRGNFCFFVHVLSSKSCQYGLGFSNDFLLSLIWLDFL